MTRIAVTGGRSCFERRLVYASLDLVFEKHPNMVLVHGGATGADKLAAAWAYIHKVKTEVYPADWETLGKAAGPARNEAMASSGLAGLVAFPGGSGTADMVRRCRAHGVPVWVR